MPKANGMFDIVTGTKRSGTSMMMYLLREAGIPIGGFNFPQFGTLFKPNVPGRVTVTHDQAQRDSGNDGYRLDWP